MFSNVYRFTLSKALLMSSATVIVRCSGMNLLNPLVMWLTMVYSAVTVECFDLKPCWLGFGGMFRVIFGRMIFSRSFAIGERRDIGRYEVPRLGSLLGLGIGIILAVFQICGMILRFMEELYMFVRYCIAVGPKCFRCLMLLLFLVAFNASVVCFVVMCIGVVCSLLMLRIIFLFVLFVLCFTVFVYCFVKLFAFCLFVNAVLLLNEME